VPEDEGEGASVLAVLERRDLTIDALAFCPDCSPEQLRTTVEEDGSLGDGARVYAAEGSPSWGLVDIHGGVADLHAGVLRHLRPDFAEDPVRVLRVARYAARFADPPQQGDRTTSAADAVEFDFEGHPWNGFRVAGEGSAANDDQPASATAETLAVLQRMAPGLNRVARDRIATELEDALSQARNPRRFFEVLRKAGALAVLWPTLDRSVLVPAGPPAYHAEGDTFEHTMLTLTRMTALCDTQGITGRDRVRRLLMAAAHDVGKTVVAERQGGLHSDEPPTRFPHHAAAGADRVSETCRRLGLSDELAAVVADACAYHMRFTDIVDLSPAELLSTVDDWMPAGIEPDPDRRTLPTTDDGDPVSYAGATPWELLDLAHADQEGRLRVPPATGADSCEETPPPERPTFDRESYESTIRAVYRAFDEISGYEVMRSEACSEHRDRIREDLSPSPSQMMAACGDCRSPGEWIGTRIDEKRRSLLAAHLSEVTDG
jgi:tRNA nucleotidyltransferase/poly(A) polymerase